MSRLVVWVLPILLVAASCGGGGEGQGEAQVWVTRDRGQTVLYEETVPAGLTVMQALDRVADVETRYGGRFVHAVDGIEGSLERGWDWFYFVNGVAADRGAAEYRLRDGEIAWWDYRRWAGDDAPVVVVGAFPEPFVHGYDGKRRKTVVRYAGEPQRAGAEVLARLLGVRAERGRPTAVRQNVLYVAAGPERFVADAESPEGPYRFTFAGDAAALAREPGRYRFRYAVTP